MASGGHAPRRRDSSQRLSRPPVPGAANMKLLYYTETDSLYIDFADRPGATSREVAPGVVLDLDERGTLVGIDIDHASWILDLPAKGLKHVPFESVSRD